MQKKKGVSWLLGCTVLAAGLTLQGCTDSNYDLGNLDLNMGFGNDDAEGLRLPANNSTREIALGNILDIDESDVISTDEQGNYVFAKKAGPDEVTPSHPLIDVINVAHTSAPEIEPLVINDLSGMRIPDGVPDAAVDAAIEQVYADLPDVLSTEGQISSFTFRTNLADEVVNLTKVRASEDADKSVVTFNLRFSDDVKRLVKKVRSIELKVSSNLKHSSTATNCTCTDTDEGIRLSDIPVEGTDVTMRIYELDGFERTTTRRALPENETLLLIQPTEEGSDKKQELVIQGCVELTMSIYKTDIRRDVMAQFLKDIRNNDTQYLYLLYGNTTLSEIDIAEGSGYFHPDIDLTDGIGEVEITNLPDFLSGDEVSLVVDNPQIAVSIASDIDVKGLLTNVKLVALGERQANGEREVLSTVTLPDISVDPHRGSLQGNTTTNILLLDAGKTPQFDAQHPNVYDQTHIINPTQGRLADLIRKIPKAITFECEATADENVEGHVILGHEYTIQPAFDFWAPLAFNEGSVIIYRDTIDGWHDDLKDLKLLEGAYVEVTADVTNRLPIDLTLTATPLMLGSNGQHVKMPEGQMSVNVSTPGSSKGDNVIEAGSKEAPKTTRIVIRVAQQGTDGLGLLDGIAYHAVARTPGGPEFQGQQLNKKAEEQSLKIDNIAPVVHGRIIVDLDK